MRREFSASLDFIRLAAASVVFLGHLHTKPFGSEAFAAIGAEAHSAVVVFFVLSGFVISWAAKRDGTAANYIVGRAARIYSVAVPALVLTYLLDVSIGHIGYQHLQPWKYVPLYLSFTTDFWFLNETAFSNGPWWSLCYEVWYYVVFGIIFFGSGRWKWIAAGACLALMGPRLWLLFPIWLSGAALHRVPRLPHARLVLVAALMGIVALKLTGLETLLNGRVDLMLGGFAKAHLRYSQFFAGDYLFAGLVALVIWSLRDAELDLFGRVQGAVAAMASISFSLYLTHLPLMYAFSHVFHRNIVMIALASLTAAALFGMVFERNKRIARALILKVLAPFPMWRAQPPKPVPTAAE